jgi:hypothetical protein
MRVNDCGDGGNDEGPGPRGPGHSASLALKAGTPRARWRQKVPLPARASLRASVTAMVQSVPGMWARRLIPVSIRTPAYDPTEHGGVGLKASEKAALVVSRQVSYGERTAPREETGQARGAGSGKPGWYRARALRYDRIGSSPGNVQRENSFLSIFSKEEFPPAIQAAREVKKTLRNPGRVKIR